MKNLWLSPPVVFIVLIVFSFALSLLMKSFGAKGVEAPGKNKAYGCGEDIPLSRVQPDYKQFFPFAFFFTIMHVATLVIATAPRGMTRYAALYLIAAVMALVILFKK